MRAVHAVEMSRLAYLVGASLAFAVGGLGTIVGLDRERSFCTTVMAVIASYYVLFAVMGGSSRTLVVETAVAAVFLAVALVGFRFSLWLVAAAGVAAGYLAFLLRRA